MSVPRFNTSKPNGWVRPRPVCDPSMRLMTYGPLLPMEDDRPGFWRRLFGVKP